MVSPLQAAIYFLESCGFFDIVLPFILVFALVFAILEKTKILGGGEKEPKRNVNALVSFVIGLFVVAATNIVEILREALPLITLVLIVLISFMLLVGAFHGDEEFSFAKSKFWKWTLTLILFVSVLSIFANFIETDSGDTWLEAFWEFVTEDFESGPVVSSILFLGIIIFVVYVVGYAGKNKESDK